MELQVIGKKNVFHIKLRNPKNPLDQEQFETLPYTFCYQRQTFLAGGLKA